PRLLPSLLDLLRGSLRSGSLSGGDGILRSLGGGSLLLVHRAGSRARSHDLARQNRGRPGIRAGASATTTTDSADRACAPRLTHRRSGGLHGFVLSLLRSSLRDRLLLRHLGLLIPPGGCARPPQRFLGGLRWRRQTLAAGGQCHLVVAAVGALQIDHL